MRKHQPLHREEAFLEGEPREDPCRQRERSEVPWLLLLHMKGRNSLVRPSEDQDQAAQAAQGADAPQLEHRLCEAQGDVNPDNPRLGDLLPVCRHAELLGRYRPMAARSHPHVYMEMLETDTYTLQEFAEVRYSEVASLAVGKQP